MTDVDVDVDLDVDVDANVDADVVAVVLLDESTGRMRPVSIETTRRHVAVGR